MSGHARELPAIIIYTRSTRSEVFDESPRRYRNEAELVVECADEIIAGQEIDDQLNASEQEALDALLLDDTLGDTADDLQFSGSTMMVQGDGARLLGAVVLTFNATYYTHAPVAGTQVLEPLKHVHTEYSPGQHTSRPPRPRANGPYWTGSGSGGAVRPTSSSCG